MPADREFKQAIIFGDKLQEVMKSGDKAELDKLMSHVADYEIVSFETIEEVNNSPDLFFWDAAYCRRALKAGAEKVWMVVNIICWEH